MGDFEQRARAFREARQNGASAEAKENLRKFNELQEDWTGTCKVCGVTLTGSLRELIEHRHVPEGS